MNKKSRNHDKIYMAYGSNLSLRQMKQRCPAARPLVALYLDGWSLDFQGTATANPVLTPGARLPIALYLCTPACMTSLDYYEGVKWNTYHRVNVRVPETDDRIITCVTYRKSYGFTTQPSQTYLNEIILGYSDWKLKTDDLEAAIERAYEADQLSYKARKSMRGLYQPRESVHTLSDYDRWALTAITGVGKTTYSRRNNSTRYVNNADELALAQYRAQSYGYDWENLDDEN